MKATRTQVEQRVAEVLALRLAGADFGDIVQYAAEQQWGLKERQLWYYCEKADERLAETTEADRGKLLRLHLGQRRLLYAKALESGNWTAALAIKKDEALLLDLYPAAKQKHEHTGPDGGPIPHDHHLTVTDADRAAAVAALVARVGDGGTGPASPPGGDGPRSDSSGPGCDPVESEADAGPVAGRSSPHAADEHSAPYALTGGEVE